MFSAIALMFLAPILATAALAFGPPEIFWVNVLGLFSIATFVGENVLKGLIAACLGLLIATVGLDPVSGYERYVFDIVELSSGVPEILVMIGMFSLPPAWMMARHYNDTATRDRIRIAFAKGVWHVRQVWLVWLRSSIIGVMIGILPGAAFSSFIAYNEAKRISRKPEEFGNGSIEGLAAAKSVNNADNAAAMIPALTLGVPGSGIAALMLGALLIHGFQPGPQLFKDSGVVVYGYMLQLFLSAALLVVFGGILASRCFSQVLRLPQILLMTLVICLTAVGSFAALNNIFFVYVALAFGVLGITMELLHMPIVPVIIGVILGGKAEFNLRVSLLMSDGELSILYTRPICLAIIFILITMIAYMGFRSWRRQSLQR